MDNTNALSTDQKNELLSMLAADDLCLHNPEDIITDQTPSFPIADFSALGAAFSGVSAALSAVGTALQSTQKLYVARFPVAGTLAKKGSENLGAIINNGKIVGQARFTEVKQTATSVGSAGTLFMAMALVAVNMTLKNIAANQKTIIGFLETDKQTALKGDLLTLSDVIRDYPYNWNNEQFISNREMQILDIKRSAEQNILFYREMIAKKFSKQQFIQVDAGKVLSEAESNLKYYQLSLYLYAFSSFLDVMLLNNFESDFLKNVADKISRYASEYESFFESTVRNIESVATASVQSRALQGLSAAGKFLGKQIAKIPDKENHIKVDEFLLTESRKLEDIQEKSVAETKAAFSVVQDSGIIMFADRIRLIDRLYNEPIRLCFDREKVYLLAA